MKNNWQSIGLKKRQGVLVPLFSVYSQNSHGIGDFDDLKLLVDWCDKTGNTILQLLPMNEVGPTFCPYDSVSSFALEPMYASSSFLKGKKSVRERSQRVDTSTKLSIDPELRRRVDYRIKSHKVAKLSGMFFGKYDGTSKEEFRKFREDNAYWLEDFCIYKAIKGYHGGEPWYEWNEGYKNRDPYLLEEFTREHRKEIDFHKWTQWILYEQFREAKKYAVSKKILLKGDLPLLVSGDSADVWAHPEFFKLEFAAGAPPDMYCAKGQRWGMPTYNWQNIEADNFRYIKEKLLFTENFYDILRIDHVVGLFRIWSIPYNEPMENQGLNGFFDPQDENMWNGHGRKLLSVLQENTKTVLCAEDLGVVPKACPGALKDMEIPGNDVQRWVKDWQVRHDFLDPDKYRKYSAAMLSTHDTTNWAAWWENEAGTVDENLIARKCADRGIDYNAVKDKLFDKKRSKHGRLRWREKVDSIEKLTAFFGKPREELRDFIDLYENTYLEKEKLWKHLKIKHAMKEKSDRDMVRAALGITSSSKAIFCIELIFDLLNLSDICKGDPYQYRVNRPGTLSSDNWSLRIPIPLEELLQHKVNKEIKKLITSSNRI